MRRAVVHVGHVLDGQHAGDDALVAVAAGHLVALLELALGGDEDLDHLLDAGGQLVAVRERLRRCTSMIVPSTPWGTRREVSRTSLAFSPKIELSSLNSGVESVSLLGVTLPTRMSPALTLAPTRMMPSSSSCSKALLAGVRDVAGDASRARAWSRAPRSENSLMWMEVNMSSSTTLLGDEDGVLVVVPVPGHEGAEDVAAEGQLAVARWRGRRRAPRPCRPSAHRARSGFWL